MRRSSALLSLALAATASADIHYRAVPLPWLPGHKPPNTPAAINNSRQICGYSLVYDQTGHPVFAAFCLDFDHQEYTILDAAPTNPLYSVAVAESGTITGIHATLECNPDSWIWSESAGSTDLNDLAGGSCGNWVESVNSLDECVGLGHSNNGEEAFLWTRADGAIGLGDLPGGCSASRALDINDHSWIVGEGCSQLFRGAGFLWTPATGMQAMDDILEGTLPYVQTQCINNLDQISGTFAAATSRRAVYVWDPSGAVTVLPWLTTDPSETQRVLALSDQTHVLGEATINGDEEYIRIPFLWDPQHGMRSVEALMDPCRPAYQALGGVFDVNADGWILARVGIQNPNTEHGSVVLIPYIPGDLDESGMCNLQDLAILLANFSRVGDASYTTGDLDCDQDVDLQDLAILLSNFGETLP